MFSGGAGGRFMMPGFWVTPPAVIPSFREGEADKIPVDSFTIDCSPYRPARKPEKELAERMEEVFREMGVVRLTNTRLTDVKDMKNYANVVIKDQMKYEGGANPREGIVGNVYEVGAPHDAWLHYHHEMAYNQHSMKNLAFCSVKAPLDKGDTYLSENLSVTDELMKTDLGRKLRDKGVCYIRCLTDREAYSGHGWKEGRPVYNHWQLSFGVERPEEAEEKAADCGLETEWVTDPLMEGSKRYLKTKLATDAFEFCPDIGRNVLFSSIADHNMWFDTWQGVAEVPPEKRPLQMTFGDGSPISIEELRQWVNLYDRGGIRVRWQTGDVIAFCNYRFAHGRPAFELRSWEERQIGVMLGEKFQRIGAKPGAW
jgi:alpha-ketoglutarate-dependent taurine dioxygenase